MPDKPTFDDWYEHTLKKVPLERRSVVGTAKNWMQKAWNAAREDEKEVTPLDKGK